MDNHGDDCFDDDNYSPPNSKGDGKKRMDGKFILQIIKRKYGLYPSLVFRHGSARIS